MKYEIDLGNRKALIIEDGVTVKGAVTISFLDKNTDNPKPKILGSAKVEEMKRLGRSL